MGVVVLVVLPVVLFPFVVAAETLLLLILLILIPFAVVSRVVFGREWYVEVRRGWTPWAEEAAGDWTASATRIHDLAESIRRGQLPARILGGTEPQS